MPRSSVSPAQESSVTSSTDSLSSDPNTESVPTEVLQTGLALVDEKPWPKLERISHVADETLTLLQRKLDRSVVETRRQGGRELSYIPSHYAIRAANEIFGYGNWNTEVLSIVELPFDAGGKQQLFVRATVKVTVTYDDGHQSSHDDIGTGTALSMADHELDKAYKGAISDAEKRALRHWGDPFGLGLYDKEANQDYAVGNGGGNTYTAPTPAQAPAAQRQSAPPPQNLRPAGQNQAPRPASADADNDPDRNTIPCDEPGCDGFVSGFKPPTGGYISVARMAELSQQKHGGKYCTTHYRNRVPKK